MQDWNLDLLQLVNQVIMAVHDNAHRFWGHTIVETTAVGFQSLIRTCNVCYPVDSQIKMKKMSGDVHEHNKYFCVAYLEHWVQYNYIRG